MDRLVLEFHPLDADASEQDVVVSVGLFELRNQVILGFSQAFVV